MIIEGTTRIAASPEQVFEFLADPKRWSEYDPTLVEVTPRDRLVVGATGIMRNRRMGMTAKATWTTTELEPPMRVTQRPRGMGYELTEAVQLTAVDGGTEMHDVITLLPTSLGGRAFVAMSRGIVTRDLRARSQRLKAMLEREPAAGSLKGGARPSRDYPLTRRGRPSIYRNTIYRVSTICRQVSPGGAARGPREFPDLGQFGKSGVLVLVSLSDGPKHGYAIMADVEAGPDGRWDRAPSTPPCPARGARPHRGPPAGRSPPAIPADRGRRHEARGAARDLRRSPRMGLSELGESQREVTPAPLYPARWRARYGDEFEPILEERPLEPFDVADILLAALDAHLHRHGLDSVPHPTGGLACRFASEGMPRSSAAPSGSRARLRVGEHGCRTRTPGVSLPSRVVIGNASLLVALAGLSAFQARRYPPDVGGIHPPCGGRRRLDRRSARDAVPRRPALIGDFDVVVWGLGTLGLIVGSTIFAAVTCGRRCCIGRPSRCWRSRARRAAGAGRHLRWHRRRVRLATPRRRLPLPLRRRLGGRRVERIATRSVGHCDRERLSSRSARRPMTSCSASSLRAGARATATSSRRCSPNGRSVRSTWPTCCSPPSTPISTGTASSAVPHPTGGESP